MTRGAYVDDVTEKFLLPNTGLFHHIHMFEPGVVPIRAAQHRARAPLLEFVGDGPLWLDRSHRLTRRDGSVFVFHTFTGEYSS